MTYKLLDLFCGAGVSGQRLFFTDRAGFEVVGVDKYPMQSNFPYEFHQADALEYLAEHGHEFDAVHASPPCQAYTFDAAYTPQQARHTPIWLIQLYNADFVRQALDY